MDYIIGLFFFVFAFFCMIFALFEERDTIDATDEEEEKSDNIIVILMASSVVLFFISMACLLSVSMSYYSVTLDVMVTTHAKEYNPLAYVPLGFAIFSIILTSMKAFQMLGRGAEQIE
jgi:exosome complex RNA-binding protein Rrp42 (RNase PH superfamily)